MGAVVKKATVLCVGKIKEKYFTDGIAEYAKRLGRFCDFSIAEIPDEAGDAEIRRESDELLRRLRGYVVLLDIGGKELSSPEFASAIDKAYLTAPEITFVIGGSRGVDDRVRAKADLRVSFGKVTYPHQLMRLILAEQIYRAFNILAGTPYHK